MKGTRRRRRFVEEEEETGEGEEEDEAEEDEEVVVEEDVIIQVKRRRIFSYFGHESAELVGAVAEGVAAGASTEQIRAQTVAGTRMMELIPEICQWPAEEQLLPLGIGAQVRGAEVQMGAAAGGAA